MRDQKIKRMAGGTMPIPASVEKGKRFNWLAALINKKNYTIGAEVGTAGGKNASVILSRNKELHLIVVDLWGPVPDDVGGGTQYKDWNFRSVELKFKRNTAPYRNRLTVLQGISWEMADRVKDNSLDFVFIDADHEYESVKKDILAWTPKLKPGGMMSGHDTHFEGVLKAINELIPGVQKVGIDHCWKCKKENVLC